MLACDIRLEKLNQGGGAGGGVGVKADYLNEDLGL